MAPHRAERSSFAQPGIVDQGHKQGGHPGQHGGPMFLEHLDEAVNLEAGQDDDLRPLGHGPVEAGGEAEGMGEGQQAHHPLLPEAHLGQPGVDLSHVDHEVAVGEPGRLGGARGAAGIEQDRQVLDPRDRLGLKRRLRQHLPPAKAARGLLKPQGQALPPGLDGVQPTQGPGEGVRQAGDDKMGQVQLCRALLHLGQEVVQDDQAPGAAIGQLMATSLPLSRGFNGTTTAPRRRAA